MFRFVAQGLRPDGSPFQASLAPSYYSYLMNRWWGGVLSPLAFGDSLPQLLTNVTVLVVERMAQQSKTKSLESPSLGVSSCFNLSPLSRSSCQLLGYCALHLLLTV